MGLRIVELRAENVKRLKAVQISPDGPVQIVAGRNAQGKTSVLDAIWMALQWKAAGKSNTRPIRDGEDHAEVRLDLGEYVVTRTWDEDGTTELTVTTPDGVPQRRQQEMLDGLVGMLSFDPLAFTQQTPSKQVETLLGLVELPFDPVELDRQRQELYDKRRLLHSDVQRAKGAFEDIDPLGSDGNPLEVAPTEEQSTEELMREYENAMGVIAEHNRVRNEQTAAQQEVDRLTSALEQAQLRLKKAKAAVFSLGEDPDLEPYREAVANVENHNKVVREAAHWRAKHAEWQKLSDQYDALSDQIAALDKQKVDGLAAAHFPIEGLGFDAEGVTYNGQPFAQASGAEQLRVSLALAMAKNPNLRVIRITDGSLLDDANMALIEAMAAEHEFQVWVERVGADSAGVVIEDGMVSR